MPNESSIYALMGKTFIQITGELEKESDRGSVVLGFAWIDDELTRLLKMFCLPSKSGGEKADELFGAGQAVGDAASKINLAYRLGLIRQSVKESLHLFRKLRNDFAHWNTSLSFETPSVRDRVNAILDREKDILSAVWETVKTNNQFRTMRCGSVNQDNDQSLVSLLDTRTLFRITAAIVAIGLTLASNQVKQTVPLEYQLDHGLSA